MNDVIVVAIVVSLAALWLILRTVVRLRAITRGQTPSCSQTGCPYYGKCGHGPGDTTKGGPPCPG